MDYRKNIASHKETNRSNRSASTSLSHGTAQTVNFVDKRNSTAAQLKLIEGMSNAGKADPVQCAEDEELLKDELETAQRVSDEEKPLQGKFCAEPIQQKSEAASNNTGLPDNLKAGIENLSGYSMDDVKVHYNSDKPSQLQAHAYAQGTDIHVAPGQNKHLPHEAWHVVQQKQGRVKPTMQMKQGVSVNADAGLEKEADVMGVKAVSQRLNTSQMKVSTNAHLATLQCRQDVVQRLEVGERPFENAYEQILNNGQWFPTATVYEKRLGAYSSGHGKAKSSLTAGITKLHSIIRMYYQNTHNYEDVLKTAFFKDDKGSAGQVGLDLDVTAMLDVINNGSLRERMTAFYNAAYFAGGYGGNIKEGFKQILHDIIFNQDTQKASDLGLDQSSLGEQMSYYNDLTSAKGWLRGGAEFLLGLAPEDKAYLFAKDVFALGNLTLQSSLGDLKEIMDSQKNRTVRDKDDQDQLRSTPEDYAKMGVPLSDRELAYAFPEVTRTIRNFWKWESTIRREDNKDAKLPWLEGSTYYTISPDNSWYKKFHDQLKMPVVAGVSGTTTRMLTAYKFLNTGAPLVNFRLAIMGWMLTSWDHSLYEILRGAHIAGLKPAGEIDRMKDVIRMYMTVTPLDTPELRANVANNKMFPHEEIYALLAKEGDQSKEHLKAPTAEIAGRAESKLATAESTDVTGEMSGVSKAHAVAIGGYTSGVHALVNTVMSCMAYPDLVGKKIIRRKLASVVTDRQTGAGLLEWINVLDPKKAEIQALNGMAPDAQSSARVKIDTWLTQLVEKLYPELKLHANMTIEGMNNLPSVDGITVYRGDWKAKVGSMYKVGGEISSNTFASYSKNRATAVGFASQYDNTYSSHPVLIELNLSGKAGKDVKKLSMIGGENEVLLMPGAKIRIQNSSWQNIGGKDIEVFRGVEI